MSTFKELIEFIDRAEKERKYLPNTARGLRGPLKLVEPELTDNERESIDLLKSHIDQIFHLIYSKNTSGLSAASVETYKRRIKNLISDYEKYGNDPSRMAAWTKEAVIRKVAKSKKAEKHEPLEQRSTIQSTIVETPTDIAKDMIKFELPFKDGTRAVIFTPHHLTREKINQIKGYVSFLETTVMEYETPSNKDEGEVA